MSSEARLARVVVYQYGGWWVLTPDEYAALLRDQLRGREWKLPGRARTKRPKWLGPSLELGRHSSCWPRDASTLFIHMPCDWGDDEAFDAAWAFYDRLAAEPNLPASEWFGHDVPRVSLVLPICPWCSYESAMERATPVLLERGRLSSMAQCLVCEKIFDLTPDGWEETAVQKMTREAADVG